MAKHCVNIALPEFKNLVTELDVDPLTLAIEISLWQDKNDSNEFPSREEIVSLLGNNVTSDADVVESRLIYGKRASKVVLEGLAKKLNGKFRGATTMLLNTKEIVEKFGPDRAKAKGFTIGGFVVVINTDLATLDTPLHEYGHVFMNFVKLTDQDLYSRIIDSSLREPIRSKIEKLYPENTEEELGEEIFVTLLGLDGQEKVGTSWYDRSIQPLIDKFKSFVRDTFEQIFGVRGDNILDIDLNSSLLDVITTVNDTLLGRKKVARALDLNKDILSFIDDLAKTKFSKIEVNSPNDLLNLLVGEDPEGVVDFDAFAKNIVLQSKIRLVGGKKLKGYIGLNGKFVPFENQTDQAAQIVQVKKERINEIDTSKRNLARNIINYFYNGNEDTFNQDGKYLATIDQILAPYSKDAKLSLLSSMTGFEEHEDIIVVETSGNTYDLIAVSGSSLSQKFKLDKGTNILGNFISDYQSRYLTNPISLEANRKDSKLLKLGLVAMKLKNQNPKATFGRLLTQNFTFATANLPYSADLASLIPQIAEIANNESIKSVLGDNLSYLNNENLYDVKSYNQDYLSQYVDFIENKLATDFNGKRQQTTITNAYEEYKREGNTKDDLIKAFEERLIGLQNIARRSGISRDNLELDPEYQLISLAILQLRNADISLKNDLNLFRKLIDSGNMTARPLIDIVVTETKNTLNNIRQIFVGDYKVKSTKMIEGLISDYNNKFGGMGVVADYTIGDTTKYFEPLYELIEATDLEGNKVEVKNGFLKRKGTDAYNLLTPYQKEFIEWTNKHIKEQYRKTLTPEEFETFNDNWTEGMLPLVKSSFTNQFYKGNYKKAISKYFNRFTNYNDLFESDAINDLTSLPNNFKSQLGKGVYGSTFRQNLVGLTDDNKLIDKEANDNIETNLEVTLDLFTMNSTRKVELDKILPLYSAARAVLTFQEHNLFNRTTNVKDYIDLFIKKIVFNANQSVKGLETVEKIVDNTVAATSLMTLGYNIVAPAANAMVGLFSNISAFTSNMIGNKDMFGAREWGLAVGKIANVANAEINNEIMYTYGMTNMDYESLLGSKLRVTDKSIFQSRWAYWLNSVGDYGNRMHIFLAQMIKDGTYSAHKVVDGKLVYDEDLDSRFLGESGQALKRVIKANLAKEPDGLDENGRMKRAYDNQLRNKYKQFADNVHGSYDRETQSNIQIYSFGRMISHMRKYIISKYERLYKEGHINETLGSYKFIKDESGNTVAIWEGKYIEGIIQTLQLVTHNIVSAKSETKPLNKSQKENLAKLLSDSIYFGLFTAIMKMLFDDEDETEYGKKYKRGLNNAIADLMSTYSPVTYIGTFSTNPIVSLSYAQRMLEMSGNLLTLDFNKFEKSASRNLFIYRDVKTLSNIIGNK